MSCSKIMDMVYEYSGDEPPFFIQVQVWLHTIFCPNCAQEIEHFEVSRSIMRDDFFPSSPGFEHSLMKIIETEEELYNKKDIYTVPGGISTRNWVIAGLVIFISLATAFFSLDFKQVTNETGLSFLLPMGIITGIVLTTYGVLFISSHLKELTERFGL